MGSWMGLLTFLRQLKRKPKKEIKVCPQCLNPKLQHFHESMGGWLAPQRYVCSDCGYFGYGYLVVDSEDLEKLIEP